MAIVSAYAVLMSAVARLISLSNRACHRRDHLLSKPPIGSDVVRRTTGCEVPSPSSMKLNRVYPFGAIVVRATAFNSETHLPSDFTELHDVIYGPI